MQLHECNFFFFTNLVNYDVQSMTSNGSHKIVDAAQRKWVFLQKIPPLLTPRCNVLWGLGGVSPPSEVVLHVVQVEDLGGGMLIKINSACLHLLLLLTVKKLRREADCGGPAHCCRTKLNKQHRLFAAVIWRPDELRALLMLWQTDII